MTQEELDKIARRYAQDELKDNHASVEDIVAAAFLNGIDFAEHHPRWISVEDALPKEWERVFITDGECTDLGFYDYTDDAWQPCERWLGDITHWMPMPQPPAVLSSLERAGKRWGRIVYGQ